MKKWLFSICLLSVFLLAWCGNNTKVVLQENNNQDNINIEQTTNTQWDINEILKNIVMENNQCWDDSQLFVDIAILWSATPLKPNWTTQYFLVANWECFKIDERWNLSDNSWFGNIPTTIDLSWDENWEYHLEHYETAKDWSEYDSSTKEMFSDEAYKIRKDEEYTFINDKSLLEMAEEYFETTIIPETENNFECKFCDKLRYYNQTPDADEKLNQTNDLYFDYIAQNNWKNTIYFGSDWTFKAEWSRDAWEWTRTFGQDENTVIVLNNNLDHVYDRYIITNQTEDSLNTILEIIQRR